MRASTFHVTRLSRRRRALATLVISLKFVVPSLMLRFPFAGAWGNYVLDVVDGDVLLELGVPEERYQTIDKAADYFSYVIMLIVGLRWRIKHVVALLFIYRTIGQALFFRTRNELAFVYFQNFLEPLVMVYTALLVRHHGSEDGAYTTYRRHLGLIWALIVTYKVWNEWYLHYANIDLSERLLGFTGGGVDGAGKLDQSLPGSAALVRSVQDRARLASDLLQHGRLFSNHTETLLRRPTEI